MHQSDELPKVVQAHALMHFGLLILVPCISSLQFTNPCKKSSQTNDASDFTKLINYLNYSVNYKVDPCEDFYQFSCGNWIANTNETLMNWEEISTLNKMSRLYEQEQIEVLNSTEQSKSEAITQARKLYHSCMRAEEEWNSTGVSGIDYVMGKIEQFGIFPMLSEEPFDEAQFNAEFDFTWLLAYFNQDDTVLDVIVPDIYHDTLFRTTMISFVPRITLLSYLDGKFQKLERAFTELLLRLMKLVAADKGINYNKTNTPLDIVALRIFMSKIYALPRSSPISMNLSQVDGTIHKWFIGITDAPRERLTRNGSCLTVTNKLYSVAMLAMYARSKPTEVLRPMAEEMVRAIITAFKDEVHENMWMDNTFKKAVLGKISRITWSLLDDDLFHNDTALDELYAAHYGLSDQPFLEMLAKINRLRKTEDYLKLITPIDLVSYQTKFSTAGYQVNAFYVPLANHIMVPLPFLQFPVFDDSFPRSYLYGSVGFAIGHEISHSLDVKGRKFDANGKERKWWKKKWTEEYDKRTLCYKEQYDNVKAYKKYAAKLKDPAKSESVDGFTQEQLFFFGLSQIWCRKTAEFTLYEELFDRHAPSEYRVNMVSKNFPSFANAFHCSPKSRMNTGERCSIW
ncbi:hypothetical protein GCK32_005809 [Trichostrongylus colubriformis]|uniref:Uncharacterized protein n=1 Tax=Trichostrongylus colubriformis TaxID=6319 RepID=A0AAN8INX1_TRICO